MHLRSLINQRLGYCRRVNRLLDAEAEPLTRQALAEGLLFHLVMTYRSYLQELASVYQINVAARLVSVTALVDAWQQQSTRAEGVIPAELRYLQQLEQTDRWLGQLLGCYELQPIIEQPAAASRGNEIRLHHEQPGEGVVEAERCRQWLEELQSLIDNQRPLMDEW